MKNFKKLIEVFKNEGGYLRTTQALKREIYSKDLAEMLAAGVTEKVGRGLYRLSDMPPLSNPDLVTVGLMIPQGVVCLISALAFHEITTQIPHEVHVALRSGSEKPRIEFPPVSFYWFSKTAFEAGIEKHKIEGAVIRVYSPEKTVADCFKFRNRIGLDVAIEALKICRSRKRSTVDEILKYARICRVEKIMKPYIEAIL